MKSVSQILIAAALPFLAGIGPLGAQSARQRPSPPSQAAPATMGGRITPVVPLGYGINIHEDHFPPAEYTLFHRAGFGLIRTDFHWQDIERTAGVYDFHAYDAQIKQLDALGVRPLWVVSYGNTLYDNGLPPRTDAGLAAFARFAGAAAAHFRDRGVLWEIWNEPNEPNFWKPQPNADQYAALVKAAVPAIRAADLKAPILAGAISQFALPYIETFLRHRPLRGVTAFSIHPYRDGQPESAISDYAAVRALIARYGRAGLKPMPVVCSEWGYSTATDQTSEADQGRYIVRMYLVNLLCGVNLTIFYDWTDDGSNPSDNESRFGIVRQNLAPKPAYTAIAAFTRMLRGYRFRHQLRTERASDYKLLFQGPRGLAVVTWTSDDTASAEAQTPRITLIGRGDASYAALQRAALAKSSPYDRPHPDVLPRVLGVVTSYTSTSPPQVPEAAPTPANGGPTGTNLVANLVDNPGFEGGERGWLASPLSIGQRLGITRAISHTGTQSAFMSVSPGTPPAWSNWGQTVASVTPGDHYTFTAWVKKADVHGGAGWYVHVNGAGGMLHNDTLMIGGGSSGWRKVTTSFTVPPGGDSIVIGTSLYGTGVAYFDDASLTRTSPAPSEAPPPPITGGPEKTSLPFRPPIIGG